jgi:hypothetical protein
MDRFIACNWEHDAPQPVRPPHGARRWPALLCAASCLGALSCSGDDVQIVEAPLTPAGGSGAGGEATVPPPAAGATYVVSSLVFTAEDTVSYVSLLDTLGPQTIDYAKAREFSGQADVWVLGGNVFVSNAESATITKLAVLDGALVERGVLSFAAYGLTSFGFWLNTFVSAQKAYFLNDTAELIVWDPSTMQLTGTVPLPTPAERQGFRPFTSYSDRAAVLRDGLLYQPFYWTDDSYFSFTPDSRVLVIDVATDQIVQEIEAPCPGLDYATLDEHGDIYLSSWVYGVGGAAVLAQPPTCVFEIPAQGEPHVAFDVASVTGGRQGGVLRALRGGRALLSVLHDERFPPSDAPSASELTFAANWRFWSYDFGTGTATPIESIDWNAGAQYSFDIEGQTLMLVAAADYSATTVYEVGDGLSPTPRFDTTGWATRLFELR